MEKHATQVAIVAVGVIAAGFIMKHLRGSVGVIAQASDGFDT